MLRSVTIVAAFLLPGLAFAQDKPISVYFRPCEVQQLNDAITAAMSAQGFIQVLKPTPGALTVSFPEKITVDKGRISGSSWSFNVAFSRDGSSLGIAAESCNEKNIAECTDQLMQDIRSAAGAP